jgi:hypothetical protein
MKTVKTRMALFSVRFGIFLLALLTSCSSSDGASGDDTSHIYKQLLIDTNSPPLFDGVELGIGRNDGIRRLYTPRGTKNTSGNEYSFNDNKWSVSKIFTSDILYISPVVTDLKEEGANSLYLGGWSNKGILIYKYENGWLPESVLDGSSGNGDILAIKNGNGRNDGTTRLYVAHSSGSPGLVEYSWNSTTEKYDVVTLINKSVGRFAIGQGRNDGINRIYAVERGVGEVYECVWDTGSSMFRNELIFTGTPSNGSVFVADGRGDKINRIYVWAGGIYELTYHGGNWSSLTMDNNSTLNRYYIYAGSIRATDQPSVYISVSTKGLYEYTWSESQGKFKIDAITGATGGCVIGDGRGDGKNRLYVANGSKGTFIRAAIVEIWEDVNK